MNISILNKIKPGFFTRKSKNPKKRLLNLLSSVGLVLLIFSVTFHFLSRPAAAAWFDDSYAFRVPVTVTNNGGADTNKTVTFTTDTSALVSDSKIQSDCDDSRFTDINGLLLQYTVSSCNTASTSYTVLLPTIEGTPATTVFYFYYGNSSATSLASSESLGTALASYSIAVGSTEQNGKTPSLYLKFDETSGSTALDSSPSSTNGSYTGSSGSGDTQLRQEINIIDGIVTTSGDDPALVQLDTTKYSGTVTYYFEVVAQVAGSTLTVALERAGTSTQDATITVTETSFTRKRSTAFVPPASAQTAYNINLSGGTTPQVKSARIIILQDLDANALTGTQTQLEIGNLETAKTNTTDAALSAPKYWYYDSSKWDGTTTYEAEVVYKKSANVDAGSNSYTTAGAFTWTAPAGVTSAQVQLWGGGGSGGSTNTTPSGGGGGAGGSYIINPSVAVTPGTGYSGSVANTRAGTSNGNGSQGNSTTFTVGATTYTAIGGPGGLAYQNGGTGGTGTTTGCVAGSGGTTYAGGNGYAGSTSQGSPAGGGAGSGGAGGNATSNTAGSGTATGGGNGGGRRTSSAAGIAGSAAGGGGGGAFRSTTTARTGGTGARGRADISWSAITSTVTIKLQEDNGSFGSWSDKATIVNAGTASSATRVRVSFTPTTGRNYRLVSVSSSSALNYDIYSAKIVVSQSGTVTKLQPQMLIANTSLAAGTSLQNFDTYFDPAEWTDATLAGYHESAGANSSTSSLKLQQDPNGSPADITNSAVTPSNRGRSSAVTLPVTAQTLDVIATTNNTDIYSSSLVLDYTMPQVSESVDPTWVNAPSCISENCVWYKGNSDSDAFSVTNAKSIDLNDRLSGSFTVQAWINPVSDGEADSGQVFWKGDANFLSLSNSGTDGLADLSGSVDLATTDATATAVNAIKLNTWQHVTMVFSSSTITLYVNGIMVSTGSAGSGSISAESENLLIGGSASHNFQGFLDDFKIYPYARTATQIKSDYFISSTNSGLMAAFSQKNPAQLTNSGLLGYWNMDESSGNAADSSGNSLTLTNYGTTGFSAGKFSNAAGVFNGSSRYFSTTTAINNIYTVSLWVYPTSTTNYYLNLSASPASNVQSSSGTISATGFTNPKIYVNGIQGGTIAADTWQLLTVTSSAPITADAFQIGLIGSSYLSNNSLVDEVRLYNRALSPTEVQGLLNWSPAPTAYWKMDEGTGQNVYDSSGNATHLFLGTNPTADGADATWEQGKFGTGLGINTLLWARYDETGSNPLDITGQITLEAWVKPTSDADNTNNETMFFKVGAYGLQRTASGYLAIVIDDTEYVSNTILYGNTWYHVAVTYSDSANAVKYYINGVYDSTDESTVSLPTADLDFYIGDNGAWENWKGLIDEVKIYDYVRTDRQIIEDLNAGHPLGGSPIGSQIIHWRLDEAYGSGAGAVKNAVESQSSLTGNLSGAAWLPVTSCKINSCTNLDTTTDNISAGDTSFTDSLTGMSVSFWVNPQTLAVDRSLVSKNNTSQRSFAISTDASNSDEIRVHVAASTSEAANTTYFTTSNLNLSASAWTHLMVVYDGTQSASDRVKVYKNGRPVLGTVTGTLPTAMTSGTTSALKLGDDDSTTYSALLAYYDELKIYNAALTQAEVLVDANAGSAAAMGGLLGSQNNESVGGAAPVGWWKLDEVSDGTGAVSRYDSSGNETTLTDYNTTASTVGKYGNAASFLRANTEILYTATDPAPLDVTGDITLTGWLKTYNFAAYSSQYMFSKIYDYDTDFAYNISVIQEGSLGFELSSNGTTTTQARTPAGSISDNVWYHFAAVGDVDTDMRIYLNGKLAYRNDTFTNPTTYTNGSIFNSPQPFYIGRTLNGALDNVKVFNYAMSPAQIAYEYNRGKPAAWYKFDECTGTTAYDTSVTGNDTAGGNNATVSIGGTGTYTSAGNCAQPTPAYAWYGGLSGKRNSSLALDGTNDYAYTGSFSPLSGAGATTKNFSWGGWFYPTSFSATATLLQKASEFQIYTDTSGNAYCGIYYSGGYNNGGAAPVTQSVWNHIFCTYDGTNIKTYINGRLRDTTSNTNNVTAASSALYFGRTSGGTQYFPGRIDDVRVFNYNLSLEQVRNVYNDGAVNFAPVTGIPE